jgi:hypothetical protein
MTRKDQILQQQLTERPRPTPLKLIPSSSSSSRRKNATPRKTISINELPRQPSPLKKKKAVKSPVKIDRLSLESVNDNAIMPEDSSSLNMSSSFVDSFEAETACNVIAKSSPAKPTVIEEGSNTFQRTLMAQGFDKDQAKELQAELVDKFESSEVVTRLDDETNGNVEESPEKVVTSEDESSDGEESEEELGLCLAAANERKVLSFTEPKNFERCAPSLAQVNISKLILRFEDRTVTLTDSGSMNLFTMTPAEEKPKKGSPKKIAEDKMQSKVNGKDSPSRNGKSNAAKKPVLRWDQSQHFELPPEK